MGIKIKEGPKTKNELNEGVVLTYFKESLRECQRGSYFDLVKIVLNKMADARLFDYDKERVRMHGIQVVCHDNKSIDEIITRCYTHLLISEIISPAPVTPNFGNEDCWGNFIITDYGENWADSSDGPIPEDILGTIGYLKDNIPEMDEVVVQYLDEALQTFERNLDFASAVMLGAAAEKLFYLIAEALKKSVLDQSIKNRLGNYIEDSRKLGDLRKLVSDTLQSAISRKDIIPYKVHEDCKDYLSSLFSAIRIQRNDAVHPVAGKVSRSQLRLLLVSFPHLCKKVYDILNWLNQNHI